MSAAGGFAGGLLVSRPGALLAAAIRTGGSSSSSSGRRGARPAPRTARRGSRLTARAQLRLYGSQGSRSPLVNWYLHEIQCPFEMMPPRDPSNPHPFGQVPALVDGDVQMFESGAILAYLADAYGGLDTPQKRAAVMPWLVWANASLDPCVFIETKTGQVVDTGARGEPGQVKPLDRLNDLLSEKDWLVGDEFSVADVAVAAYLLYVPLFFRDANMGKWPAVSRYMLRCVNREAYAKAYAEEAGYLRSKCAEFVNSPVPGPSKTKKFGIF